MPGNHGRWIQYNASHRRVDPPAVRIAAQHPDSPSLREPQIPYAAAPRIGSHRIVIMDCLLSRVYFRGLSTFEGLTCPRQHVINARFAPSPVTGSVYPLPRLAGREPNPTRPSSALLFNVLQWKRVRNSGHALTRRRVNRRPGDGARQQAVLDTYLIPQRSSYRRTLLCAPGWPPPYPWDADFAGCLCPSLL